jgi:hypothetical protein
MNIGPDPKENEPGDGEHDGDGGEGGEGGQGDGGEGGGDPAA